MPDVKRVTIQTARPIYRNGVCLDPGACAEGWYVIDDDTLTMTDSAGRPVTDAAGNQFTAPLAAGDDAGTIAGRLTRRVRERLGRAERSFHRRIVLPNLGIA